MMSKEAHASAPYIEKCPIGCTQPLQPSIIALPEGALLRCTGCGQLVGQCSPEQYWAPMQEFNDSEGTLPKASLSNASFDALTLLEVIEHLKDPAAMMKECFRILRPGGVMLVGTGNAGSWTASAMKQRWEYFDIAGHGGHISFFNPASIKILAERCGFQVLQVKTLNVRFFEKGDVPRPLYKAAKVLTELLNFPARLLNQGHDMLVTLRRPLD